jgi:hypothetical protein
MVSGNGIAISQKWVGLPLKVEEDLDSNPKFQAMVGRF